MADTKEVQVLWSGDMPGGKLVVRFEPEGFTEPTGELDWDTLGDEIQDAITEEIDERVRCLRSTLESASSEASEAEDHASEARRSIENACSELDDGASTVTDGVVKRLERALKARTQTAAATTE